jgi:hypothetical protein
LRIDLLGCAQVLASPAEEQVAAAAVHGTVVQGRCCCNQQGQGALDAIIFINYGFWVLGLGSQTSALLQIRVLIDMDVWMKGRRPEILALRPAATQVMAVMAVVVVVVVAAVVVMMAVLLLVMVVMTPSPPQPSLLSSAHIFGLLRLVRRAVDRRRRHGQVVVELVGVVVVVVVVLEVVVVVEVEVEVEVVVVEVVAEEEEEVVVVVVAVVVVMMMMMFVLVVMPVMAAAAHH